MIGSIAKAGVNWFRGKDLAALGNLSVAALEAISGPLLEGAFSIAGKAASKLWGSSAGRLLYGVVHSIIGKLCFVGGTPVLLGDGETLVDIDDIRVGWRVATDGGVSDSGELADDPSATDINASAYRLLTFHVDGKLSDGADDPWEIQTLVQASTLDNVDVESAASSTREHTAS